jgi:hypothetical protein
MQKYHAKDVADERFGCDDELVYLASEVDAERAKDKARIAELEKELSKWYDDGYHRPWCSSVQNSIDACDCGLAVLNSSL